MHIALHERAIKDEDRSLKKIQNYRPGKQYKAIQAGSAQKNDVSVEINFTFSDLQTQEKCE